MLVNACMSEQPKHPNRGFKNTEVPPSFNELLGDVAHNKNKDSFVTLFNHFAPRVKSFLMKSGLNPEIADEIAQETMLTIWNKAESYNPAQAAASTWIFTIARNKRIDHLRKTNRYYITNDENLVIEDDAPSPSDNVSSAEETERLTAAISTLPEEQKLLIQKSFFEDKSHAIIAEETGIALGTVKSRIRLALQRLRRETGVKELWN